MVHESQTPRQFHAEYVYASNSRVPQGTNIPHSERDAAYKASLTASNISDSLGESVSETYLIGDSQIALWWILNKEKKT